MTKEGFLSKWTNVMRGWQFRWFVLDENTGLLSYYTSREKMRRGVRRGCIRLQGAILGIDDEEDSNFTITVDAKIFHLQAKDAEEREIWVRSLEEAILKHSRLHRPGAYLPHLLTSGLSEADSPIAHFEQRLAQADVYLQMMIQQIQDLEKEKKPELSILVDKANQFLESVKHSIVLLQIAKNTAFPVNSAITSPIILHHTSDPEVQVGIEFGSECQEGSAAAATFSKVRLSSSNSPSLVKKAPIISNNRVMSSIIGPTPIIISPTDKPHVFISYSSSDDEDFFDATEDIFTDANQDDEERQENSEQTDNYSVNTVGSHEEESNSPNNTVIKGSKNSSSNNEDEDGKMMVKRERSLSIDYDALYDEDQPEEDLGSVESHGSVLSHILSQVKIGMDLTKVVLPTFILERRSLLEMYADFFAHPDMFVNIADEPTPRDRFIAVLRWYLGSFHAGRRSEVAKKPYNPIIGEVFECFWNLNEENSKQNGSSEFNHSNRLLPWVENPDALCFTAEQVSHHPPISGFYAEHYRKKISLNAHIWTKSKFLGLSIGVINVGHAMLTLHEPKGKTSREREDYVLGFPNGYARAIITCPWIELGGSVTISSTQTGYHANIEFKTKPFFSGDKNKVVAQVFSPEDKKKPFLTVEGEWNGLLTAKWADGRNEKFIDVKKLPIFKKNARPIIQQESYESRRLWKDVTAGLKFKNIEKATESKFFLEEKQRREARERAAKNETWKPKNYYQTGDNWIYINPLELRVEKTNN